MHLRENEINITYKKKIKMKSSYKSNLKQFQFIRLMNNCVRLILLMMCIKYLNFKPGSVARCRLHYRTSHHHQIWFFLQF